MSELPIDDDLHWPEDKEFTFLDSPGAHDPCFVVMPDGSALPLNHWNNTGTDIARAKWIVEACNQRLARERAAARLRAEREDDPFTDSDYFENGFCT